MIALDKGVVSAPSLLAGLISFIPALSWLRVAKVVAPLLIGTMLIGLLLWTRSMLASTQRQLDDAVAEVVEFRRLATDATVLPAADGSRPLLSTGDAKAALAGAFRDRDDARASLTRVDRDAKAAKVRADAADATLVRAQAANARAFDRAEPVIARLEAAQPTGSPATDAAAIDDDSKSAWEAWR